MLVFRGTSAVVSVVGFFVFPKYVFRWRTTKLFVVAADIFHQAMIKRTAIFQCCIHIIESRCPECHVSSFLIIQLYANYQDQKIKRSFVQKILFCCIQRVKGNITALVYYSIRISFWKLKIKPLFLKESQATNYTWWWLSNIPENICLKVLLFYFISKQKLNDIQNKFKYNKLFFICKFAPNKAKSHSW